MRERVVKVWAGIARRQRYAPNRYAPNRTRRIPDPNIATRRLPPNDWAVKVRIPAGNSRAGNYGVTRW